MLTCNSCGESGIPDGTPECPLCHQQLGMTVLPVAVMPVMPVGGPLALSGSAIGGIGVLIPIIADVEDPTRAFTFPQGVFEMLLGRTDLSANPPIVAQIDVTVKWPDLNTRPSGNLFSRATATIRRNLAGEVFVKHDPRSSIRFVYNQQNDPNLKVLLPGDEIKLEPDMVLTVGKSHEAQAFVVR